MVSWQDTPDDHGSAVTSFIVMFKESNNLNFSPILDNCNPVFNSASFLTKSCAIPMSVLRKTPYSVPVGQLIVVKMQAVNSKGASLLSEANTTGALA